MGGSWPREVPVAAIHFAPDGLSFAAVRRLNTWVVGLTWWNLRKNKTIVPPPGDPDQGGGSEEDAGYAPDPALSADHRFLAYVYIERGPEYSLRLIDRAAPKKSRRRERRLTALEWDDYHNDQEYRALGFSPDGQFLVAAVTAGDELEEDVRCGVYRWRVSSLLAGRGRKSNGEFLPREFVATPRPTVWSHDSNRSLAFSPGGTVLAAGLWRDQVPRWAFPSGAALPSVIVKQRPTKVRRGHPPPAPLAWRLAFSADGQTLAVADETVTLYETGTVTRRAALPAGPAIRHGIGRPPGPYVHDLAFHPSEPLLATACGDEVLHWWDGVTGAERATFDCGIGPLTAVAFSPDGCVCAAAGEGGRVALVDVDR
jgi:WD40 repeat protein